MNPLQIAQRAGDLLAAQGQKRELSPQAQAVIVAISEAVNAKFKNARLLVKQADATGETPTGRMKKPTFEEVRDHGRKIELSDFECRKFYNYYESNGWRVGRNPMKLWTAAMANWKRNCSPQSGKPIVTQIGSGNL